MRKKIKRTTIQREAVHRQKCEEDETKYRYPFGMLTILDLMTAPRAKQTMYKGKPIREEESQ